MKSWLVLVLFNVAVIITTLNAVAQETDISKIPPGRYLVIGTFHIKQNALGFYEYVKKQGHFEPKLAYHPLKQYYYVYIKEYSPGENGYSDVQKLRKETEFSDTWFMVVQPYQTEEKKQNDNLVGQTPPSEIKADQETSTDKETASKIEDQWVKIGINQVNDKQDSLFDKKIVPVTYEEEGKYKMYFNTYYVKNYKEVKGPVEVVDPYSLKLIRVFQSLELVMVPDPKNKDHAVQLIANIFGYKKVQHDIKLDAPLDSINAEFIHFKGDTLIASFPLRRYDVGDIATMYNVYFFEDAVIMKPISKYELSTLVEMLKENPNLKIRIHGHTNGNKRGRMILLPEDSEKFFTLNQPVIEKTGSAKELSLKRAEIIKRYLMSFGISPERMEVIGWGGKKPIYDEMSKLAIKNVRVEIEILEN